MNRLLAVASHQVCELTVQPGPIDYDQFDCTEVAPFYVPLDPYADEADFGADFSKLSKTQSSVSAPVVVPPDLSELHSLRDSALKAHSQLMVTPSQSSSPEQACVFECSKQILRTHILCGPELKAQLQRPPTPRQALQPFRTVADLLRDVASPVTVGTTLHSSSSSHARTCSPTHVPEVVASSGERVRSLRQSTLNEFFTK